MAVDTTRLITDAAKYQAINVNPKMQQALRILGKAGLSGATITAAGIKSWIQDSENLVGAMTPEQLRAALVNVWIHAAINNSIAVGADLSAQISNAKIIAQLPQAILDRLEAYSEAKAVAIVLDP